MTTSLAFKGRKHFFRGLQKYTPAPPTTYGAWNIASNIFVNSINIESQAHRTEVHWISKKLVYYKFFCHKTRLILAFSTDSDRMRCLMSDALIDDITFVLSLRRRRERGLENFSWICFLCLLWFLTRRGIRLGVSDAWSWIEFGGKNVMS